MCVIPSVEHVRSTRIRRCQILDFCQLLPLPCFLRRWDVAWAQVHSWIRLGPVCWANLPTLDDRLDCLHTFGLEHVKDDDVQSTMMTRKDCTHRIDELTELFLPLWVVRDNAPFVVICAYEFIHVTLEVRADAQLVIEQNLLESLHRCTGLSQSIPSGHNLGHTSMPPSICSTHRAVRMSLSAVRM